MCKLQFVIFSENQFLHQANPVYRRNTRNNHAWRKKIIKCKVNTSLNRQQCHDRFLLIKFISCKRQERLSLRKFLDSAINCFVRVPMQTPSNGGTLFVKVIELVMKLVCLESNLTVVGVS